MGCSSSNDNNKASLNSEQAEQVTTDEDIVAEIKAQTIISIGKANQETVFSIIDSGIELIRLNTVKDMSELKTPLDLKYPNDIELVSKVLNSTTGFLTAKGFEADSLLSSIFQQM